MQIPTDKCDRFVNKTLQQLLQCKFTLGVRVSSGQYLTYTGPIISSLLCTGSESSWKDCALGSVGSVNCGYDKAVVLSCLNGEERA